MAKKKDDHTTIRISLRWILLAAVLMFAIGMLGGLTGATIFRPSLPPLTNEQDQLITTVQEVTISPSKARVDLVNENERAVVLLAEQVDNGIRPVGIGIVLTNDGLVVSTEALAADEIVAFDDTGRSVPLSLVGEDELFGLTYYRLRESLAQPFAIANQNPEEGAELAAIARSAESLGPAVSDWMVEEYRLPQPKAPLGRQQTIHSSDTLREGFSGAALLTGEGELAGILLEADTGLAIPASDVRLSLNRVTTNEREFNPLDVWGFRVAYEFQYSEDDGRQEFVVRVAAIDPGSPAAISELQAGDIITAVNGRETGWGVNLVQQLSAEGAVTLAIERNGRDMTLVLNPDADES